MVGLGVCPRGCGVAEVGVAVMARLALPLTALFPMQTAPPATVQR